ncbi:MAG: AtpZ/AtpI family protein [Flavobacteriaceae bacterium]|nr:AtpZ/AtpI family protein [Flavobacteriaceae bacterium]
MPDQKKSPNKYVQLTGIAFQMGATIYLAVYLGKKLDIMYPNEKKWFTLGFTLIGLVIALYAVVVQSNKINSK